MIGIKFLIYYDYTKDKEHYTIAPYNAMYIFIYKSL